MEYDNLSPIILFTYNRLEELKQTIAALQNNKLANNSILYVYSDGAKTANDNIAVDAVRDFLKTVSGFKDVILKFSEKNKGLAPSIIEGVTTILEKHGKVIVLEDDLLVSDNFLSFMNSGLDYYYKNPSILSICGYNMKVEKQKADNYLFDMFFAKRSSSWGWATWKNKWKGIDWNVEDYDAFSQNREQRKAFNECGSDMFGMLKRQQQGKINSWAVRYNYHQFKNDLWSVFPITSKVKNIGFSSEATHTNQKYSRFDVNLDKSGKTDFKFTEEIVLDIDIQKQFKDVNSIKNRIIYKIKNLF
ncbi:Glycosyl transferase family 2 [Maribacter aquivivus]|uniref:Glycosyl transferase family 2 n=1 Tax=Maribacter aquivivus TaxID=228958 RepID=A0A1M6LI42_9FLAO|nr:glycosyltransferase [Maribacter aquivivus]SHJ70859.1 Glycosyl transferase family 2 [Maribacter aquivivus]